jgi:hypothetical protein
MFLEGLRKTMKHSVTVTSGQQSMQDVAKTKIRKLNVPDPV